MKTIARSIGASVLMAASVVAQQPSTADVVRDLRSPDERTRLNTVRMLRQQRSPDAVAALAVALADPSNRVQLEAIDAELSLFLSQEITTRKRVALIVEVRSTGRTERAFALGPSATYPRPVPSDLILGLRRAVQDEDERVRLEAIYLLGVVARPPLDPLTANALADTLRARTPALQIAAARVMGRLHVNTFGEALIEAVNDPDDRVRVAAMRALGETGERRAVRALTEQFEFYQRGAIAEAAFDGLARIADPSSMPLFEVRMTDGNGELRRIAIEGVGRSRHKAMAARLEMEILRGDDAPIRLAMSYALHLLGRPFLDRVIGALDDPHTAAQAQGYLYEIRPADVPNLFPYVQDPEPRIRTRLAETLGMIGDATSLPALERLRRDPDAQVAAAALIAIERIKLSAR